MHSVWHLLNLSDCRWCGYVCPDEFCASREFIFTFAMEQNEMITERRFFLLLVGIASSHIYHATIFIVIIIVCDIVSLQ